MRSGIATRAVLLCGVGLLALAARAQDQNPISEIVVTANKHAEKLHDVAQEVSAVTGADLARRNESDFRDFAAEVPGFQIEEASPVFEREILRGQNSGGAGATVATVIDDMPLSFSGSDSDAALTSTNVDTYDLQRIEVLKGPQGTLYGATAEGGVVKYVTNPPNLNAYQGGIEATGFNVSHGQTSGSVKGFANLPLVEGMAALRITGVEEGIAGYIDNPLLNKKDANQGSKTGLRASLLLAPSENLSIRLTASQQLTHTDDANQIEAVGNVMFPVQQPPANELSLAHGYVNNTYFQQNQDSRIAYYYANVDYDMGWASLTSITSVGQVKVSFTGDNTNGFLAPGVTTQQYIESLVGVPLAIRQNEFEAMTKLSEEVRLASAPGQKLFGNQFDWIIGGFATRETVSFDLNFDFTNIPGPGRPPAVLTSIPPAGGFNEPSRYREWALFGQGDYYLLPNFDIAAGVRVSNDSERLNASFGGEVLVPSSPPVGPLESKETPTTWSVAPRLHLSDDTLLYGRVATGYRPGGPNLAVPQEPADYPKTYGSDSTYNYELGAKSYFFGRSVDIDVALYDIEWSHIQVNTVVNTPSGPYTVVGNVGSAASRGVEYTLGWTPIEGLRLTETGAYTDAHLTQDAPAVGGAAGDTLSYVPRWSNNINVDYDWPVFGDFTGFVGGAWNYVGSRYTDFAPAGNLTESHTKLPAYNRVNLQAGIRNEHYTAQIFAQNIGDTRGISSYANTAGFGGTGLITLIEPRTIGVRVGATF